VLLADEVVIDQSFPAARQRLESLVYSSLVRAAEAAYCDGLAGLTRVGPVGAAPGISKLVDVHVRQFVSRDDDAVLSLGWESTGPCGLFPALDADITLKPAGDDACRLAFAGVYHPPLAALGSGLDRTILHRAATATARSLLHRIAVSLDA